MDTIGDGSISMKNGASQNSKRDRKRGKILIVGSPNVGKSVVFNNLTGAYATVSNYPGTTVEISKGTGKIDNTDYEVFDCPGMYSLLPITEEERVSQKMILNEKTDVILHVTDAKNIERMLPFTFQLIEAGLPVILVLNIMDEAEKLGIDIDSKKLEAELGIPVVPAISVTKHGMKHLRNVIAHYLPAKPYLVTYDGIVEEAVARMQELLKGGYPVSKRAVALLLLQNDSETRKIVESKESDIEGIRSIIRELAGKVRYSVNYSLSVRRHQVATAIGKRFLTHSGVAAEKSFREILSRITMNPWTGFPILLLILYFGLYKFVGGIGAGVIVDFLENTIFEKYVTPHVTNFVEALVPWPVLRSLFVGEYGIITLGIRYAVAIILPIVGTFFIVFAIIEDSGYLPRLSMLMDRLFKKIGLSGRAVIPMVLGLGCDTMAIMVTRTLATKRERIIATLLLSLAIPCSAQIGVIMSLFGEENSTGLLIWAAIITAIFLLVGYLVSKVLPGDEPVFFMEVPPLRMPKLSNVIIKTYTRMEWYFMEVCPLFILASVLIWLGQITGIFETVVSLFVYPVRLLDMPDKSAVAFFFGFFRRDYGAAGLYDLKKAGLLNGNQILVACVTLTLFLPCIAQFIMNIKERGWKTGVGISIFVLVFSFGAGYAVNTILLVCGIQL
jgi:ferrous iron transport protein B